MVKSIPLSFPFFKELHDILLLLSISWYNIILLSWTAHKKYPLLNLLQYVSSEDQDHRIGARDLMLSWSQMAGKWDRE